MGAFPLGKSPQTSHSSSYTLHLVEFPDEFDGASHDAAEFSYGAPDEDELSITALGNGLMLFNAEDSAELPHSG